MKTTRVSPNWTFVLAVAVHLSSLCATGDEPAARPAAPRSIAFAPGGALVAVGDGATRTVHLLAPGDGSPRASIKLTGIPEGLAWTPDGKSVFASEAGAGTIARIDTAGGKVMRRLDTGRYPSGLALAAKRGLLLACDRGLDRLTVIETTGGKALAEIPTGRQPGFVALSPDESLAVVSNLIPATAATAPDHATEITLIDLATFAVRSAVRLPTGSTNARGIAIDANGEKAYVVHTLGRFHLPTTQLDRGWVNTNALSILDLKSATRLATVLLDQVMEGAADPWDIVMAPDGSSLYITLSGAHQLAVIDLKGLSAMIGPDPDAFTNDLSALHRERLIRRIDLPANGPRGLDVSSDGRTIATVGYFTGNVVLLDTARFQPVSIPLGPAIEPDETLRGEIAFHDAGRCFQRWLSCATCHADARVDGLNWDLLNDGIGNPKNSRSMLLVHATPPVMSLGARADMDTAVRAGFVHIQFTRPEDDAVEAVSAYLRSLQAAVSPYRKPDGSLTEAAIRGEEIFHRASVGCANCHPAPLFTNLKLKDVGTATPRDRGATEYDVPTLVELWRTPPYLHDGRAATLREVLTRNPKLIAAFRHHHLSRKGFRPSGRHLWMRPASGPPALAHQSTAPTVWR